MSVMESFKLFVYGSWSTGYVHFEKLRPYVKETQDARISGKVLRTAAGFPILMESESEKVEGEILSLIKNDFLIALLDEFHGVNQMDPKKSLFFRVESNVETLDSTEKAWVYFANPLKVPKSAKAIPQSNWRESLQQEPPLSETLTERQRTYVLRLGQTTGREIVPIDLPLYRELMNLELIVDKGRRLALSKLGHEVFKSLT
jgi:gamma-glutamylcyclotransferase (GGCT)/AIG2-like uncharacterized protein YtfP